MLLYSFKWSLLYQPSLLHLFIRKILFDPMESFHTTWWDLKGDLLKYGYTACNFAITFMVSPVPEKSGSLKMPEMSPQCIKVCA